MSTGFAKPVSYGPSSAADPDEGKRFGPAFWVSAGLHGLALGLLVVFTLALKDNQKGLGAETDSVAKKELNNAPVFQRLLERVARNMNKAGDRFGELVTDVPAPDKLPDDEAAQYQKRALEGLRQLLESLKEQAQNPQPLSRKKDGDEGGDEGGGGGGGRDFGDDTGGYSSGGGSRQQRPQPAAFDTDLDDDVPF